MEKIKYFIESDKGKDILVVIIIILVGIGSFELGRLSNKPQNQGIKIEYPDKNSNLETNVISASNLQIIPKNIGSTSNTTKNFFASSKGSKYYSLGCSAGKTIKQENRIYFMTGQEAETAGYTLSSSCS